jgi:hypothetical protein
MAINPVVIEFLAKGMPNVSAAFKSVQDQLARSEGTTVRQAGRAANQRVNIANQEAKQKIREAAKAAAEQVRLERAGLKEAANAAREQARIAAKAANEKIRESRRVEAEEKRAAAASMRLANKAANEKIREYDRVQAKGERGKAAFQRELANEEKTRRRELARTVVGAGSRAVASATGLAQRAAGTLMQVGGGFSLADSLQRHGELRGKLADISNRGVIAGDKENSKRQSVDSLKGLVSGVGVKYGIDPNTGAEGLDKFASKTGNLKRGTELLDGLAQMSRAGAGSLDDLADAAGDVFNNDKTQNAEQVLGVMRALAGQGKIGAVEMKDLAKQMAGLQAAAGRFQGDPAKSMAMMGGLAQLARESGGAKSAAQATTSVQSLTNQLFKGQRIEHFKELGVDLKDDKGFNRNMDDILVETMLGAEKKSRKGGHGMRDFDQVMGTAVADAAARRATTPLEKAFKEAGGGAKGADAARALLSKFSGASMSKGEVASAANERMKEADVQLEQAMIQLRDTTARELGPALQRMIPPLTQLIPRFGQLLEQVAKFAAWAASNPFAGFGAIVTGFFIKELIAAKISSTISSLITGGGAGGVGGKGNGIAGTLGTLATVAAVSGLAVGAGQEAIDNDFAGAVKGGEKGRGDANDAAGMAARLRMGTATDEDRKRAAGLVTNLKSDISSAQDAQKNPSFVRKLTGGLASFTAEGREAQKLEGAGQQANIEGLAKTLRDLEAAIKLNTAATKTDSGGAASPANGNRAQPIPKRTTQ